MLITERGDVVSVMRSDPDKYSMHTTRSWEFSGLEEDEGRFRRRTRGGSRDKLLKTPRSDFLQKAGYGKDVIVGVLDSGN